MDMINHGQIYFRRLRFRMQIAYSSQNGILKNNWYRWTDASGFSGTYLATHRIEPHVYLGGLFWGTCVGELRLNGRWVILRLQDCGIECKKKWVL